MTDSQKKTLNSALIVAFTLQRELREELLAEGQAAPSQRLHEALASEVIRNLLATKYDKAPHP